MSQPMEDQPTQKAFGGCEGPDAMYVKLISSDGHEFIGMYIIYYFYIYVVDQYKQNIISLTKLIVKNPKFPFSLHSSTS